VRRTKDRLELSRRPEVKESFLAFAVGIQARVEAALRRPHLSKRKADGFLGDPAERRNARQLPSVEVDAKERGVVVEHFFEMRPEPVGVDGVPVETAAKLV